MAFISVVYGSDKPRLRKYDIEAKESPRAQGIFTEKKEPTPLKGPKVYLLKKRTDPLTGPTP